MPYQPLYQHYTNDSEVLHFFAVDNKKGSIPLELSLSSLLWSAVLSNLAVKEGFEPSKRYKRLHTFQACSFSHSDTSPLRRDNNEKKRLCQVETIDLEKNF